MKFGIIAYLVQLIISFTLVSLTAAKCGQEMSDFYQCFRKIFDSNLGPYTRGITFEEFQKQISKCFTSNGCEDVKLETRKELLKRSGQIDLFPDNLNKLKACKSKIRQKLRQDVEKCVQKQLDGDFKFPAEKPTDYVDFPLDTVQRDEIYVRSIVRSLHNEKLCPSSASLAKVVHCVTDLYDLFEDTKRFCKNPFDEILSRTAGRAKACEYKCFDKLGKCHDRSNLLMTFQSICDCNRNVTQASRNNGNLENDLQKCMPEIANYTVSSVVEDTMNQVSQITCAMVPDDPCKIF